MAHDKAYQEAEKKIAEALKSHATKLDLSDMQLTELPELLGQLTQIQILNLSSNLLTELPEWLLKLTKLRNLHLVGNQISTLPNWLGQFTKLRSLHISRNRLAILANSLEQLRALRSLHLSDNQLTVLPDWLGQLTQLISLDLSNNQLTILPDSLGQLTQLTSLDLSNNQLTALPDSLRQLTQLTSLNLLSNQLTALPDWLGQLTQLTSLKLSSNQLTALPDSLGQLTQLTDLDLHSNQLTTLPDSLGQLTQLASLDLSSNQLTSLPDCLRKFAKLEVLNLDFNKLESLPDWIGNFDRLFAAGFSGSLLSDIPLSFAQLERLSILDLGGNPLNPALQSAYDASENSGNLEPLFAYLRSLEQNAEPLYEAKLVLVGEGNVGKTTLLKALKGDKGEGAPKKDETKTHGVEIDIHGLRLTHPAKDGVEIQLNAWDFGGQDVYRVTHQFFFSRRSLYLLVWEPRRNVQQGQVEDWLNMIRLRVGDEARVLIISTHCKTGETLARIDQSVLNQQYGKMIVGFYEVDSLVPDEATGEMTGIAELKKVIAEESAKLEQMGMGFNRDWKAARDELLARPEPRISYGTFSGVCAAHGLSQIDADTLAHLMHDLGYIVHYADEEKLRDDVVLKPEWLTKAIGFVLEDRATAESDGILPDKHLYEVWHDHQFKGEPRYDPDIYPFFLHLMEKYDVCYRLTDGKASLVAQHVPQVRPELPWLPEDKPKDNSHRIAMVCSMDEEPQGLVPWMIVRTHDFTTEKINHGGETHRLHWQKGMFLTYPKHGEAFLEKRDREFHIYAQADYPEYFMNVLQYTLQKLITDNWPGLEGRYRFTIPCPGKKDGKPCSGRFSLNALRQFQSQGVTMLPCQECYGMYSINELMHGFEERSIEEKLQEIRKEMHTRFDGLDSRIADYFMATMHAIADEAKNGPRLFTFRQRDAGLSLKQIFSRPIELQLWCEAEGCQHPVVERDKGYYPIEQPQEWVMKIAPYANFALNVLATVAPMAAPAINAFFGDKTTEKWKINTQLDLAKAIVDKLPAEVKTPDRPLTERGVINEPERSGILALHRLLNEIDPTQSRLGLYRVATYTGDYRWLCKYHYDAWQPNIPDVINTHE